jgi:hypothetical protein
MSTRSVTFGEDTVANGGSFVRSFVRLVVWSFGRLVVWSFGRSVVLSFCRSVDEMVGETGKALERQTIQRLTIKRFND